MVKVLTTILSFLFVAGCSFRNQGHDQDKVYFEEHEITADEKQKVEKHIKGFEDYVEASFYDRDGIFIVYDTQADVYVRTVFVYYVGEQESSIEACYLENLPGKNVFKCAKIDVPKQIIWRLRSIDFSLMSIVVSKLRSKKNSWLGYPRMYVMNKKGKDEQFALFYNPRSCLKSVCRKDDQTEVPDQYLDNAFLFDMAHYFTYEIRNHEGTLSENAKDSLFRIYFK